VKNSIKIGGIIMVLFLITTIAFAQKSRQQLEKEKTENIERLKELRGILNETATEKRASLGQLKAIKQQISAQNRKIDLINEDLSLMTDELKELESAKGELDKDLEKLRQEYAKMIYAASKRNNSLTELNFLFSSSSFNQFMIRYKYLKQYTKEREKQVAEMKKVQNMLATKSSNINNKKKDQQNVLQERLAETQNLEGLKGKQNSVVKELSSREVEIRAELAEVRRENQQLESSVRRIIAREMAERAAREKIEKAARQKAERIARENARKEIAEAKEKSADIAKNEPKNEPEPKKEPEPDMKGMTAEEFTIASTFQTSKGRLAWPVRSGFVSDHFGIKKNEDVNVLEENQGVDIQTNAGESIRAVYDGEVMSVENFAIVKNVIFIKHGDFYTVYSKLKNVTVRAGQKIKARDVIGTVATNNGVSEINFQIWKDTKNLNPELWLAPR
jgi:murein hydrolase activator